jgi:hypothetical protein
MTGAKPQRVDHRQRGTLTVGAKAQNVALEMYDGSETPLAVNEVGPFGFDPDEAEKALARIVGG